MEEHLEARRHCWKCRRDYPPEAKVCVQCGVNLETGQLLVPEPTPEDEEEALKPKTAGEWFFCYLPGLLRPILILAGVGLSAIAVILWFLCLVLLSQGVALTAVTVGAVGLLAWAQVVVWVMTGRLCLLHDGLTEFQGAQWHLFVLLVLLPLILFGIYLKIALPPATGES